MEKYRYFVRSEEKAMAVTETIDQNAMVHLLCSAAPMKDFSSWQCLFLSFGTNVIVAPLQKILALHTIT